METVTIIKNNKVVAMAHFDRYSECMQFAIDFLRKNGTEGHNVVNTTFFCPVGEVCDESDIMQFSGAEFMRMVGG